VPALKAVQAWVAEINAKGGVSGHPIEFTVADDGNDPSRNRALIQQMVEQEHVIAFLLNCAPLSGAAAVSYIQQKQIPVIGVEGGSEWANENSMYFPQLPNGRLQGVAFSGSLATAAIANGTKKVALITCTESPACKTSAPNKEQVERFGAQVVYSADVSLAQPDFTAQCLSARNAGAGVVMVGLDAGSIMRFADSCSNLNYSPTFGSDSQSTTDDFLRNHSLDGMIINSTLAPWFLDALPSIAAMRSAMGKYAPGVPVLPSSVVGWSAAKLFERAAGRLPDSPTSADILAGLWRVRGDDLDRITTPLTFDRGATANSAHIQPCWWTVRLSHGTWINTGDGTRHCP
jgi:branched-chain amino acid transport system substrate-binding protein